jgi:CheY-like chemotaxis protein
VVEDDVRDQTVITQALVRAGYRVEVACTGAIALEKFRAGTFDAVTLDLLLPDMSGLEVLDQIRRGSKAPEVPVLVVTILPESSAIAAFSVHDVLSKPVNGEAIGAALRRAGVGGGSGYVLVADDDVASSKLMQTTLESLGHRCVCEQNGRSALAVVEHDPPSAIILDLMMPEMSGFEFLERLRSNRRYGNIPVIVWTAQKLSLDEQRQLQRRADAVLGRRGHPANGGLVEELRGILARTPRAEN